VARYVLAFLLFGGVIAAIFFAWTRTNRLNPGKSAREATVPAINPGKADATPTGKAKKDSLATEDRVPASTGGAADTKPVLSVEPYSSKGFSEIENHAAAQRKQKKERRDALIQRALQLGGKTFSQAGANFRFLQDVRGISDKSALPAGAELIENHGGIAFFIQASGAPPPVGSFPAVYNEAKGSLAMLTGNVKVATGSPGTAQALAEELNMKLIQSFDDIKVSLFQSGRNTPADLVKLLSALREDKRVQRAELILADHRVTPR